MKFGILHSGGKIHPIRGEFASMAEVKKLRVLKDNPSWEVVEITPETTITVIAPPPKRKYHKHPTKLTLQQRELAHCEYVIASLAPIRLRLATIVRSAARLKASNPDCGCNTISELDYWVTTELSYDYVNQSLVRARKRKQQLLRVSGINTVSKKKV